MNEAKTLLMTTGRLALKATPGARKDEVGGLKAGADGKPELHLKVRAVAEDGKANEAIIELLSDVLDLPKSRLEITRGSTSRHKVIAYRRQHS